MGRGDKMRKEKTAELGGSHEIVVREKEVDLRRKKFFLILWPAVALYEQKRIILSTVKKPSIRFHAIPNQQYAAT